MTYVWLISEFLATVKDLKMHQLHFSINKTATSTIHQDLKLYRKWKQKNHYQSVQKFLS